MEVAEQIVVLNDGHIEQEGSPRELYETPANEFVMSFVGPVNQLDGHYIRPHDIDILVDPSDQAQEAMIDRIIHLGFEVRVELTLHDGSHVHVQLTQPQLEELELHDGQIVWAQPSKKTKFENGEAQISAS